MPNIKLCFICSKELLGELNLYLLTSNVHRVVFYGFMLKKKKNPIGENKI